MIKLKQITPEKVVKNLCVSNKGNMCLAAIVPTASHWDGVSHRVDSHLCWG